MLVQRKLSLASLVLALMHLRYTFFVTLIPINYICQKL